MAPILKSPVIVGPRLASGAEPGGGTPEAFAAYIREEYDHWGTFVRERGIKPN